MIRYPISKAELEALIDAIKPAWRTDAAAKTKRFKTEGKYSEEKGASTWSQIKSAYIKAQGAGKCIFCERKLESDRHGKIEYDVEHFRPKGNIKAWKVPQALVKEGVTASTVPASGGYHLLAYHIFNYAASCKTCNSILKKDYFPVAGNYVPGLEDPTLGGQEMPLLVYPISDFDDDPQELIAFEGVLPQAMQPAGHARIRALVTIEFFKLDQQGGRTNLLKDRATMIAAIYPILEANNQTEMAKIHRGLPHFNCVQSFMRLYQSNREQARKIYKAAKALFLSTS